MRLALPLILPVLLSAGPSVAGITVNASSASACVFTYEPGKPVVDQPDTVNLSGINLQWQDSDCRVGRDLLQPVRIFVVAVPPGTTPRLRIVSQQSSPRDRGLPGRAPSLRAHFEGPNSEWARLLPVSKWRGYPLARIEVSLQIGDDHQSEVLNRLSLEVSFAGTPAVASSPTRDARLIETMAVNGRDAALWWQPDRSPVRRTSQSLDEWPEIPLYRLGVEETGLYRVTGGTLRSHGVDLVGRPSSSVKVYGNGGGLLPKLPETTADSLLKEDAILMFDGGDGVFDESDSILFYARGVKGFDYADSTYLVHVAHQNPFTKENIYFIGADPGGSPGLRMEPIPTSGDGIPLNTTPGHEYVDNDLFIFAANEASTSGLVWYMYSMSPGDARTVPVVTDDAVGDSAWLTVALKNRTGGNVQNAFDIYFDSTAVSLNYFPQSGTIRVPIGPEAMSPGSHNIQFINRSTQIIYINYLELEFTRSLAVSSRTGTLEFFAPRNQSATYRYEVQGLQASSYILDVTDRTRPRVARGSAISDASDVGAPKTYFAVTAERVRTPAFRGAKDPNGTPDYRRLRNPENRAGLVIITYDGWFDALEPLKQFHESYREDSLATMRVKLTDIYDEFGWGVHDVVAIRNFLKYAYENWQHSSQWDSLQYVLFVGDGDYDYRNLISSSNDNWMPPWEWEDASNDDFFATFSNDGNSPPQLFTGRWPLQSQAEVEAAINKTVSYANNPLYSPWKATATFAADDEWKSGQCGETMHTLQSEALIDSILPDYFSFKKIYEILYPMRATPTGTQKPEATQDLLDAIHRGTLIVNYAGHGNERVWTDEQLFLMDRDNRLLDNYRMWPLFVAATCSWGGFDQLGERCFPELLLADDRDGAIASLGATRVTFAGANNSFTTAFYREIFRQGLVARRSFGEALTIAKYLGYNSNPRLYHVFGDPVLRLATPERFARVTSRDDSMQALSLFHLSGVVSQSDGGPEWSDFQGVVEARVYDTQDSGVYYWPDPQNCDLRSNHAFYYGIEGNAIFRGKASIRDGHYDVTFRVPRDVRYGASNARVSLYFSGKSDSQADSADGIGIEQHVVIANEAASAVDSIPPLIHIWLESASFRSGDLVGISPLLHVDVSDSSGINLSGQVGHRITARVDDAGAEDLTQFYNYHLDSYTVGSLETNIGPLSVGEHRLLIEAWDSFNNLNQATVSFVVGQSGEAGYGIRDVLNWPNPMSETTYFTYYLTQGGTSEVNIRVFTLTGKLVWEESGFGTAVAFNSNHDHPWDGRDREGHQLGNGVYLYRVRARNTAGHTAEAIGKLVILR